MINRIVCALFLFALVGLDQPSSAAVAGAVNPPSRLQTKTPEDARIEYALKTKLAKSKMSADHFSVSVLKGVVTIEGNTSVMQRKGAMTRMARTSGATSVRNNIRISDEARSKAAASLAKHRETAGPLRTAARGNSPASESEAASPIPRAAVLPVGVPR